MSVPKITAMLLLVSALSLISHGPVRSAPLISLSAAADPGTEQIDTVQVRWRRVWHNAAAAPPTFYGGSYLGYTYGGFPGYYGRGYVFPNYAYGYRPFGWFWYGPY
jgi:hypothetical protein